MIKFLGPVVSVLLPLATLAVYLWLVLGPGRAVIELAGGEMVPDLRPMGYDLPAIRAWLLALPPEGVAIHLGPLRRLDTLFPVLMGLTLLWWMRPLRGFFGAICAVTAFAYVGLDLAENWAVAALVRAGPFGIDTAQVAAASGLTQAKFLAIGLGLTLAARQAWRRWQRLDRAGTRFGSSEPD